MGIRDGRIECLTHNTRRGAALPHSSRMSENGKSAELDMMLRGDATCQEAPGCFVYTVFFLAAVLT